MAGKASTRTMAAIAAGIVAVLIGASVVFGLMNKDAADSKPAAPSVIGPDTVQTEPGDPAAPDAKPTQLAGDPDGSQVLAPQGEPQIIPGMGGTSRLTFDNEALSFDAALPAGAPNDPVLIYLRRDSQSYLDRLKTNATADYNRLKRAGEKPTPWEARVKWSYTAKAGGVVSLVGEASEYNGGAHPALLFDSHIARAVTGETLTLKDMLLIKRSPSPAMTIAICEALKSAKARRIQSATIFDEPIVCAGPDANAKVEYAVIALAPSNQLDKFGGLYAFYAPYVVGANSEGAYRLTVQQDVFAEDLKPEFKALFAGEAPVLAD